MLTTTDALTSVNEMNEDPRKELVERVTRRSALLGAIAIDTLFVLVWLAIQVGANVAIKWLVPGADDLTKALLTLLQVAFGAATVWPVARSIYNDVKISNLKGKAEIRRIERQIGGEEGDDGTGHQQ